MARDRPRNPTRISGQWPALALAIAVHVAFVGVLVFSLRWQNRKPEPTTALLYAPPAKAAIVESAAPPPPESKPEPKPAPVPAPRPEPPVAPAPPKVEPRIEKPDTREAAIAEKARKDEDERKERGEAARDKREREKKETDQRDAEKKKRDEQQRAVEARDRQKREVDALRAQAEREQTARERQKRETDALRAQTEREQAARAAQQAAEAAAAARTRAEADYIRRIQSKVKGNVTLPPDMSGSPEAIFDVVQLPTGEIIDAILRKSSGSRTYDDAVARAIVKSSPLPRPERPELFQRILTLKFRPQD